MDFKHIQRSIIGGAIGEGLFAKVSFLEANDFDIEYRDMWQTILDCNGDLIAVYKRSKKIPTSLLVMADYTHIDRLALLLLEMRFKTLLIRLLGDIAINSNNATEGLILSNTINEIEEGETDVFDLIDSVPDYLKPFISDEGHQRLYKMQKYVNDRGLKIKKVLV